MSMLMDDTIWIGGRSGYLLSSDRDLYRRLQERPIDIDLLLLLAMDDLSPNLRVILKCLAATPGRVVSTEKVRSAVWKEEAEEGSESETQSVPGPSRQAFSGLILRLDTHLAEYGWAAMQCTRAGCILCKRHPYTIPFAPEEIHPASPVVDLKRALKGRLTAQEEQLFDLLVARLGGWVLYYEMPGLSRLASEELLGIVCRLRGKLVKTFGWTVLTWREKGCMLYPMPLLLPKPEHSVGKMPIEELIVFINRRLDDRCSWCPDGIQRKAFRCLAARHEELVLFEDIDQVVWAPNIPTSVARNATASYLRDLLAGTGWTIVTAPGVGWKLHQL